MGPVAAAWIDVLIGSGVPLAPSSTPRAVSEQFQSSSRAASEQPRGTVQVNVLNQNRAAPEQFQSDFRAFLDLPRGIVQVNILNQIRAGFLAVYEQFWGSSRTVSEQF